jgi:succinate dehydrogenase/fumarate reductase flavoprotein subunit
MTGVPTTPAPFNEKTVDLLVIGSGAGALTAAVTAAHHGLSVLVAEKEPQVGGTSAWSGGWMWIPRNPLAQAAGIIEDPKEPRRYLKSELGNRAGDPRLEVFLENGPEMVRFLEANTAMKFIAGNSIPDFHETPGRTLGGRSLCAAPFDGRTLGNWIHRLRPPLDLISPWGMGIASGADLSHFLNASRSLRSAVHVAGRLVRHARDRIFHGRGMRLVNGNALVARLLKSALDKGVEIKTSCPATRLIRARGRVTGAVLCQDGAEILVNAQAGVVLGTGGFPHDPDRIRALFDHTKGSTGSRTGHHSAAPRSNTGDGLRMAEAVGAQVVEDLVSAGAWAPVSLAPRKDGTFGHFPHLIERAKPGYIAVTKQGARFVNEADSYHDFMNALFQATPEGEEPECWLLCDHPTQRRFGLGFARPFPFPLGELERNGYLITAPTLEKLAEACGIAPSGLESTVKRFNAQARAGTDPDFNRGVSAYNRIQGDPQHGPNPSLGPVERGPFHAVHIVPGSLGTFAGLRSDPQARVLDPSGAVIPGLFAVGNDLSSVMGGNYPSGGITLGPSLTFGYVIGRVAAGLPVAGLPDTNSTPETAPHTQPIGEPHDGV